MAFNFSTDGTQIHRITKNHIKWNKFVYSTLGGVLQLKLPKVKELVYRILHTPAGVTLVQRRKTKR